MVGSKSEQHRIACYCRLGCHYNSLYRVQYVSNIIRVVVYIRSFSFDQLWFN